MEEVQPRRFSAARGGGRSICATYGYLLGFVLSVLLLISFWEDPYHAFRLFEGINLLSGRFLLLLTIPIVLTLAIHRSFLNGTLASITLNLLAILILPMLALSSEERGYISFSIIYIYTPLTIVVAALGVLLRPLAKVRAPITKVCMLGVPFTIMLVVLLYVTSTAANPDLTDCSEFASLNAMESCFERFASLNNDASKCGNVANSLDRSVCIAAFAIEKENISICEAYLDSGQNRRGCFWSYASRYKEVLACSTLTSPDDRDECYYGAVCTQEIPSL